MKHLTLLLTLLGGALLGGVACADPLRIATGGHYPPYIYDPMTDQTRGFDKDLMDEICTRGDFECTWVDLPMGDIFQALARGDVDVVTGGFGYSVDRDALVDFTCPYMSDGENNGTFIGTRPNVDLITARIATLDQSLYQTAMVQADRDVRPYPSEAAALDALLAGDVDVAFGSHNMESLASGRDGLYNLGEYPTFSKGTVLGVSEDAPTLRHTLDTLLADMSTDGTLGQLQERWFDHNQGDVIARCLDLNALT